MTVQLRSTATVTIPSSSLHVSDAADIHNSRVKAIVTPSAWSSAVITFQGSFDGTTYYDIYTDTGTQVGVTALSTSLAYALTPTIRDQLASFNYVKLRSGVSSSGDDQSAARVLTLALMPAAG